MKTVYIRTGIFFLIVALAIFGGYSFIKLFGEAMAPAKIVITKNNISTNKNFTNGIAIEEISADSMGANGHPVMFTTIFKTEWMQDYPKVLDEDVPDKIEFNEPGQYAWYSDTQQHQYELAGLNFVHRDSVPEKRVGYNDPKTPTCPIKIIPGKWYLARVHDPSVTGIFFTIDSDNKIKQFFVASGVSPI